MFRYGSVISIIYFCLTFEVVIPFDIRSSLIGGGPCMRGVLLTQSLGMAPKNPII